MGIQLKRKIDTVVGKIFHKHTMKPILKWVGGKTQILEDVLATFPREIENYYEPFLGGGSVLLGLLQSETIVVKGKVYASDVNANLIGLYQNVQKDPQGLIREVKKLVEEFGRCKKVEEERVNRKPGTLEEALTSPESYYYWIRGLFNAMSAEERIHVGGSAMLLFLNKTCFRGVYREGPHGFNVPYGNYKNPGILEEDHILEVSELIQGVVFSVAPFQEALQRVKKRDFVYMDPPYAPVNETSFVKYNADGFGLEAHKNLFTLCSGLSKKKVGFVMSNADVPLVRNAFVGSAYTIKMITCRRAIHSKNPDSVAQEVLIIHSCTA